MKLVKLLILVCFSWCIIACGNDQSTDNLSKKPVAKQAKGEVQYGGVFKMNEEENFRSLYPLDVGEVVGHRITNQLYEGLVRLNQADLTIEPAIAESWEVNDSSTLYTFKIRKGIKFHDDPCFADGKGRELTAKDVKYCFDLLCTFATNNKGYKFVQNRIVGAIDHWEQTKKGEKPIGGVKGITLLDENTVQIQLAKPFSSFLHILAMPFGFVFPQEAYKKYGEELRTKAVGTGPFYLKTVKENEAVILLRNPTYWGMDKHGNQLPYLDGVRFSFIKDKMSELLEFKQGRLDMVFRLPLEMRDEIVSREGQLQGEYKKYQLQQKLQMDIQYYAFLNNGEIFNNKKLRQAFNYAIDRKKLVDYTVKGAGVPGNYGIVPPVFANYEAKKLQGYNFDPEKARELLKEAGYENGKDLPALNLQINSGGGRNEQVAEAAQKMLEENLNITVNISVMAWPTHLENLESGKVDFWRAGWIADYPDPENFLNLLWSKHIPTDPNTRAYLNPMRFKNETFDKNFEEALRTVDDAKRNALYLKADQAAIEEAPIIPLFHSKEARLLQANIRNFPQNAMEYRLLNEVYFTSK